MLCTCLLLSGCSVLAENSATGFMMDTVVNIKAVAKTEVLNEALDFCRDYEKRLSRTYADGEIYLLNKNGCGSVSDETAMLLEKALYYCALSDGRFDISVGNLVSVWDFKNGVVPEQNSIKAALDNIGYKKIIKDANNFSLGGTNIDLGAVAKGYIADKTVDFLKNKGIGEGLVNVGGNIAVFGDNYVNVGIKNPFGNGVKATVKVKNTSVVTSGTYERSFTANGKKYHHVLSTADGYPVETNLASATVICEDGAKADILSTLCIIYGLNDALKLISETPDAEAIFITNEGEIFISNGIYSENGYYRI